MTTKAKTKVGIYTLTRDSDGGVALWDENAKLVRSRSGIWSGTDSGRFAMPAVWLSTPQTGMVPAIRKGTRARVRVAVEVIDERR